MFEVFANLSPMQLDSEKQQWSTEPLLTDERETAKLREDFLAVPGHDLRSPLAATTSSAELLLVRHQDLPDVNTIATRLKSHDLDFVMPDIR
jgi:K+-sensing histidine kinase KdpD